MKKMIVIFAVAAAVTGVLATIFIWRHDNGAKSSTQNSTVNPDASLSQTEQEALATLKKLDAVLLPPPPPQLTPYNAVISVDSSHYYQYVSADQQCSFAFGVRTAQDQAGDSFTEMSKLLSTDLQSKGMHIESQEVGTSLTLSEVDNSAQTYALPTTVIAASKNGQEAVEYFSAAILKNNDRISVTRTCQSLPGSSAISALASIEAVVRQITIQIQQ